MGAQKDFHLEDRPLRKKIVSGSNDKTNKKKCIGHRS